jgi:DNA-binding CsgD family transcriptional regulator
MFSLEVLQKRQAERLLREKLSQDMPFNHTDARIAKLFRKGLPLETIARKIGRPGDTLRVLRGLEREGLRPSEEK